ncbi:MAG: ABC transporter ATP-binding protein [Caldilineaceae bacterium]
MTQNQDTHATRTSTENAGAVLVAEELRKVYGSREALHALSFSLKAGHVLGFLGPNGAGKTTAIRILTTILEPTSGKFFVDGLSSDQPDEIRHRIGVLPESLGFAKQMTGLECLAFFGQLYGQSPANARKRGLDLLEKVGLHQRSKSLIGAYSRGMRQRLGIARALVNDPVVVFLDEPTLGLDPQGQQELLGLVRWVAREHNAGVVLCSHALTEVEGICDDVVILNGGQIVVQGTVGEVTGRTRPAIIQSNSVRLHVPSLAIAQAQQLLAAQPHVVRVTVIEEMTDWLRVEFTDAANSNGAASQHINNRLLDALIRADIPVLAIEPEGGRLQDVFLHVTERAIR